MCLGDLFVNKECSMQPCNTCYDVKAKSTKAVAPRMRQLYWCCWHVGSRRQVQFTFIYIYLSIWSLKRLSHSYFLFASANKGTSRCYVCLQHVPLFWSKHMYAPTATQTYICVRICAVCMHLLSNDTHSPTNCGQAQRRLRCSLSAFACMLHRLTAYLWLCKAPLYTLSDSPLGCCCVVICSYAYKFVVVLLCW